jgi:hypothetical protein
LGDRLDPEPFHGHAVSTGDLQVVLGGALVFAAGALIGGG